MSNVLEKLQNLYIDRGKKYCTNDIKVSGELNTNHSKTIVLNQNSNEDNCKQICSEENCEAFIFNSQNKKCMLFSNCLVSANNHN